MGLKTEFCIMPDNPPFWRNFRYEGSHRHEVFFGPNRQLSIEDGLVIFLDPDRHNMNSKLGIHYDRTFDLDAKRTGQRAWMEHYGKTKEDFVARYGRNYL